MNVDLADVTREMIENRNGIYLGDLRSVATFFGLLAVGSVVVIVVPLSPVVALTIVVPLISGAFSLCNLLRVRSVGEISRRQWGGIVFTTVGLAVLFALLFGWVVPIG